MWGKPLTVKRGSKYSYSLVHVCMYTCVGTHVYVHLYVLDNQVGAQRGAFEKRIIAQTKPQDMYHFWCCIELMYYFVSHFVSLIFDVSSCISFVSFGIIFMKSYLVDNGSINICFIKCFFFFSIFQYVFACIYFLVSFWVGSSLGPQTCEIAPSPIYLFQIISQEIQAQPFTFAQIDFWEIFTFLPFFRDKQKWALK